MEHPPETPRQLELLGGQEKLLFPGSRCLDVDRREDPLLGHLAVQPELPVTRPLELLEDDLVHAGSGLDESRGEDRERAALLDVSRRTEETLRRVQRGRVDTTREDAAGRRGREV